jgi:serine/threonine protein kinase
VFWEVAHVFFVVVLGSHPPHTTKKHHYHQDIKPDNIVLEGGAWGGRVFLVDFGGVQGAAAAAPGAICICFSREGFGFWAVCVLWCLRLFFATPSPSSHPP